MKGHTLREIQLVTRELFGAAIEQETLAGYSADFRSALQSRAIVSGGWYPVEWLRQTYAMLYRSLPKEPNLARRLGQELANRDLAGMYSFILKLTSPELIARHFDKILASYMRGGTVTVEVHKNELIIDLVGWTGVTMPIWEGCLGGFEVVLKGAGVRGLISGIKEVAPGNLHGDFRWE
jgi:hypothetical protein